MIRLGIIGCGDVAFRTYLPTLKALRHAKVQMCFSRSEERARRAAAMFPPAVATTDLNELLLSPTIDAVLNLTPPALHAAVTRLALTGGKHVYTEKPLAQALGDAVELAALADHLQLVLSCAPAVMATPRFQWLKSTIDAGRIGRPILAVSQMANLGPAAWDAYDGDPRPFYQAGVGPMMDLGVYALDAIVGLLGSVRTVQAVAQTAIPERTAATRRFAGVPIDVTAPDIVMAHLELADGSLAQVLTSYAVPASRAPELEIHGTRGSVSISAERFGAASGPVEVFGESVSGDKPIWHDEFPPEGSSTTGDLIAQGVDHFVSCVAGTAAAILTPDRAIHVLEIMLAAKESARHRSSITLKTAVG